MRHKSVHLSIIFAICATFYFVALSVHLANNLPINIIEGLHAYLSHQFLLHQSIYPPAFKPPYTLNIYPPIYTIIGAIISTPFQYPSLIPLRVLSLLSEIGIALIITLLTYQRTKNLIVASLLYALAIITWATHGFHGLARIDFFLCAILWLCCFSLTQYIDGHKRAIWWFGAFLTIALLTKQSAMTLWLSTLVYNFIPFPKKASIKIPIFTTLLGSLLFTLCISQLLQSVTGGEYLRHTSAYLFAFGFSQSTFWQTIKLVPFPYLILFVTALLTIKVSETITFLRIYLVISLISFFVSIAKNGSDLNYTIEPISLLLFQCGYGIEWITKHAQMKKRYAVMLFCILAIPLHLYYGTYAENYGKASKKTQEELLAQIIQTKGDILSEDPYYGMLLNKTVVTYDPYFFSHSMENSQLPVTDLVENFKKGNIPVIITSTLYNNSPELQSVLNKKYHHIYKTSQSIPEGYWNIYIKN